MVKYRFKRIETVEDILEAIGRKDIPSTKVVLRRTINDLEIEIPDEYALSPIDEEKLKTLIATCFGMKFKEKISSSKG